MAERDDFMGGSGESLKFEKVGDTHEGTLLSIASRQDKTISGELRTWDDGSPMKVFIWEIETANGPATMWVRGHLVTVLREAARKAGAKSQADLIGAKVLVKHHELGEAQKGMSPAKLFQAKITLAPARAKPAEEYDPFKD